MANLFDQIVKNYENSMRGVSIINKEEVKSFPHVAGSVFISKVVSLLRTMVNEKNVYSNLDIREVNNRMYQNDVALIISMVFDETVEIENMFLVYEAFQNVSTDIYLGMKSGGKYGTLQKDLRDFHIDKEEEDQEIEV